MTITFDWAPGDETPRVRVPGVDAYCCTAASPGEPVLYCTRAAGHEGRHAAGGADGTVFRVWTRT